MSLLSLHRFDGSWLGVAYWDLRAPRIFIVMGSDQQHLEVMQPSLQAVEPQQIPSEPLQSDGLGAAVDAVQCRVSLEAEVPELLYDGMRQFISNHPHWDQYRLVTSALANFLFQNGCSDPCVTQHYLNGLFLKIDP